MTRLARLFVVAGLVIAATRPVAASQAAAHYAGRSLDEVLQDLQRQGLSIIYSSELVKPEWRVAVEPRGANARAILDDVLAAHGLAVRPGPRGALLVVAVTRQPPATQPTAAGVSDARGDVPPAPRLPAASLEELLERASEYVQRFVTRFANVVATEHYSQWRVGKNGRHDLTSDFLLLTLPGSPDWIECRDVYEVDGRKVGDRERRLLGLLQASPSSDWIARAQAVARESTRYNLENIGTLNRPLVTIALLQSAYQRRLTFTLAGSETRSGVAARVVRFRETAEPAMFRQGPLSGRIWIDAMDGVVLRTELQFGNPRLPNEITTTFTHDPRLGVHVPADMTERYYFGSIDDVDGWPQASTATSSNSQPESPLLRTLGPNSRFELRGHATYGQFRRFGVTSTEQFGQ